MLRQYHWFAYKCDQFKTQQVETGGAGSDESGAHMTAWWRISLTMGHCLWEQGWGCSTCCNLTIHERILRKRPPGQFIGGQRVLAHDNVQANVSGRANNWHLHMMNIAAP